jgi:hypothetical protein
MGLPLVKGVRSGDTCAHLPRRPGGASPWCYIFLTYHCAYNGLPLGPSSLLRHTPPSRTDYDSYTSF